MNLKNLAENIVEVNYKTMTKHITVYTYFISPLLICLITHHLMQVLMDVLQHGEPCCRTNTHHFL